MPSDAPICDTDGCDTVIQNLADGWPNQSGRLACADCWEHWIDHGHWPDEEPDHCVDCETAEGRVDA